MAIILDDAVKEIISKASLEQTSSLLRGATAVTPYEAAAENPDSIISSASKAYNAIEGGAEALASVPLIATQIVTQVVTNVSMYATEKIGKALVEVIMPPSPAEIFGKAAQEATKFIKSAGELIKELTSDCEQLNLDDAKKMQEEAIKEKAKKQMEKVNAMKKQVQTVVSAVQTQCENLQKYITQGEAWVEKNANEIEEKAKKRIDEVIDVQVAKILYEKKKFIEGMAEGIAKRTADIANKTLKKITKEQIDKINAIKQKIIITAKALIGKALLALMAALGL